LICSVLKLTLDKESTAGAAKTETKKRGRPRKSDVGPAKGKADLSDEIPEIEMDEEEDDDGRSYWLMKAEPESRVEKGVDVKFSIDDLAAAKEPEPWEGKSSTHISFPMSTDANVAARCPQRCR